MSEYKTIVLLKGLEGLNDYQFRTIKSLLRKKLNLTEEMQENYDRIQMADLIEKKIPKDAGLDLLINLCESMNDLEDLAKKLKTEKAKVKKEKKRKNRTIVKKGKQEEPSSSQSLSTDNESDMSKPSAQKKRKQTTKTEGGKKMKLTQEQTQLLAPSGSNPQKDECCLQTPHKPPPTPSSSSSNKKNTNIKKQSTIEIQVSQKKHQHPEFSATSNSSAASKLQTLPEVAAAATASNSLQTSLRSLGTCFTFKMSSGSPAPTHQNFPMSPAADSSIHLNSPVPLVLSSGVQAPHVPSATASGNSWVTHMLSKTVSSSLSTPQMAPISMSSNAQNIHLPTAAVANSKKSPHSPHVPSAVPTFTPAQTLKSPSATLKSKAQVRMMPLATASSNIQVPNDLPEAIPKNDSTTPESQRAACSGIQTLNSTTVRAPRNVNVPGPLETGHVYFQASLASPATASGSLPTTSMSIPDLQVPRAIGTNSVQTTQTQSETASNFIQAIHASLQKESRSVCTTQGPQGASYGTGQALPCPRVKASRRVHAPQMPSATASESLLAPCGSLPTASSSLLDPWVSPAMAFSALQAPLVPPPTASSRTSWTPKKGNLPKEPSKVEGHHRDPIEVMVLKVTEPFTYDLIDDKRMFHATVATETEFFRVKVFDTALKNKFIPKKIIAISDYFGVSGFLEIYRASCVSDVNVNRTMVISNILRRRANGTPKIKDLFSQIKGTYVNGEFVVTMKNERGDFIYYGIEDDTGKMEVVVSGRLTSINCEPGNKVQLICFQLTSREDTWQLKSVRHSYMQVISAKGEALNPDSVMKTSLEQYF